MKYVGVFHNLPNCGIGHRLLDVMQAVLISKWYGLAYAHSPLVTTTTVKDGGPHGAEDHWARVDPWEYHLRLGCGEPFLPIKMLYRMTGYWGNPCEPQYVEVWPPHAPPSDDRRRFRMGDEPLQTIREALKAVPHEGALVFRSSARLAAPCAFSRYGVPEDVANAVRKWFQDKYTAAWAHWQGGGTWRKGGFFAPDDFAIALLARYGGGLREFDVRKREFHAKGRHNKYIPGPHYLHLMTRLRKMFPGANMILFTDLPRDSEEISPLVKEGFNVVVCFEEYPLLFNVFHSFVAADIVFDGNSGTAAFGHYMGNGVLMQPTPTSVGIGASVKTDYRTGEFNEDELKRAVEEYRNGNVR